MIRRTRQRDAVVRALRKAGRPLTPEEIFQAAQADCPGIGLRTVYRHIRELSDAFQLVGVDYPGQPRRYEPAAAGHHAHFICRRCQRVFDIPGDIPDIPVTPPPGFRLSGQETVFYGTCAGCADEHP